MLAEATIVPRAVLDLGLRVDVQEGALLVAALPCRETQTCVHPGQPRESWTQTPLGFSKGQGLVCSRGPGGSGVQSCTGKPQDSRVPQSLSFLICMCAVKVLPSYVSILSQG